MQAMAAYRVTLRNDHVEEIADADAYQQEGQMTTFFRTGGDRQVVDSWSVRVASFRTTEILIVRREDFDRPLRAVATRSGHGAGKRYSEACS